MPYIFQWMILPLADNCKDDVFLYEVHVHTGFKSHSGTKSKVSMILSGTESDTGIRKLSDGQRQVCLNVRIDVKCKSNTFAFVS